MVRRLVRKTKKHADAFAIGRLEVAAFAKEGFAGAFDELGGELGAGRSGQVVDQLGFVRDLAKDGAGLARTRLSQNERIAFR